MFISERLALAGYQPNKPTPILSGLGGRRINHERVPYTAFRETVEELFHVKIVPSKLIKKLEDAIIPIAILENGGYCTMLFDFTQLEAFCKVCKRFGLKSPLYRKMPTTLDELLFRRLPDPNAEVSHLCILPIIHIQDEKTVLDMCFLSDLRSILKHPHLPVTS